MTLHHLLQAATFVATHHSTEVGSAHDVEEFALDKGVCKLRQIPLANLHNDNIAVDFSPGAKPHRARVQPARRRFNQSRARQTKS